ncbi:MAG: T9SS type A sorting domain-containing protein [Saprospiraceae bacterium]
MYVQTIQRVSDYIQFLVRRAWISAQPPRQGLLTQRYFGGQSNTALGFDFEIKEGKTLRGGKCSLYVTQSDFGYKIEAYNVLEFRPSDPTRGQAVAFSSTSSGTASASPNPFSEVLEVFLPASAAQQISLQLFNLSGQKVLDQRFTGGQEQYSLSTEGLSTGFYLLRIEADGEVQTLKVVKSE